MSLNTPVFMTQTKKGFHTFQKLLVCYPLESQILYLTLLSSAEHKQECVTIIFNAIPIYKGWIRCIQPHVQ